jgi:hypothetical protein
MRRGLLIGIFWSTVAVATAIALSWLLTPEARGGTVSVSCTTSTGHRLTLSGEIQPPSAELIEKAKPRGLALNYARVLDRPGLWRWIALEQSDVVVWPARERLALVTVSGDTLRATEQFASGPAPQGQPLDLGGARAVALLPQELRRKRFRGGVATVLMVRFALPRGEGEIAALIVERR